MYKIKLLILSMILVTTLHAKVDTTTGLIIDEGISDIKEHCTICHTGRFIVVNGGKRAFWEGKIIAMQDGFGLWDLTNEQKDRILNYLTKNYSK
ncbi:MAG TPA: hypothetical protein EYG67_00665 [Campylobacterales bacterium]|nr:hypothetical protein [Campylobacterales bacterium]HIP42104.1 hypothetical protein [Campylobacterales bacterium]